MATGRQAVAYDDQRITSQSFWADGVTIVADQAQPGGAAATMIGKAVTFSADDTVALAADGDAVIGKLLKVEKDGLCTVQIRGNATLPLGSGGVTATRGRRLVGCLNAGARGYVRDANSATAAELVRMGPIVWNSADANNIVVDFLG